ncbi:MAG: GMP synthase, partial [Pseudomonadota bacterium]
KLMSWPSMIYQFHKEGFSLPSGAVHLASSDTYPNQAFRYGDNAWAVQFHAELTQVMIHRWAVRGAHRFGLPGAQPGRAHINGRLMYDAPVRAWLEEMLTLVFERGEN